MLCLNRVLGTACVFAASAACAACGYPPSIHDLAWDAPQAADSGMYPGDASLSADASLDDAGSELDSLVVLPRRDAGSPVSPPIPEGPRVEVDAVGRLVLFHRVDGIVVARMQDRLSYPLPEGALVTLAEQHALVTVMDVTAPATIHVPDELRLASRDLQTVEFALPEDRPELTYTINNGCTSQTGKPGLNQLQFREFCVDERGGELVVTARESSGLREYVELKDIDVRGPVSDIVHVTLPAWQSAPAVGSLTLTGLPAGSRATVNVIALRGRAELRNLSSGIIGSVGSTFTAPLPDVIPSVGARWLRSYTLHVDQSVGMNAFSKRTQDGGFPLQLDVELPVEDLLPVPSIEVDLMGDPQVSWSSSGVDAGATRIAVKLTWDVEGSFRQWTVWMQPTHTSLSLPNLPDWLLPAGLEHIASVEVRFEKRDADTSWSDVLSEFRIPRYVAPGEEPLGFVSKRTWTRSTP